MSASTPKPELILGLYREAIATYTRGAVRARAVGHRRALGLCLVNTGLSRLEQAEWELAEDSLEDTLALTKDGSMPRTRATAEYYLGLVAEGRGDSALAAHHFTQAIELRHAAGQEVLARDAIAGQLRVAIVEMNLPRIHHLHTQLAQWIDERGVSGIEFPVRLYISLYRAEMALGDDNTAPRWLDAAEALLAERASHISDDAARRSYLEQVPAHRELHRLLEAVQTQAPAPRNPVRHATAGCK